MFNKYRNLIAEFFRYVLVGGSAFVLDFAIMYVFNEFVFAGKYLYVSVFLGYLVGLIYNFILSCSYVFKNGVEKIKGKELQSFVVVTIIGLVGLGLTELLMYIFVDLLNVYYLLAKMFTGAIVMFWNYIARKVIVFK